MAHVNRWRFMVLLAALLASSTAWSSDPGSCDPNEICILSATMNSQETIHYVNQISMNGLSIDNLPDQPRLQVENETGDVRLVDGPKSVVVGTISVPVGENAQTELIRNLILALGTDLSITSRPGKDISTCNPTAIAVIYEHSKYHTKNLTLTISQENGSISQIMVNQADQAPYSTISTPIPCAR